MQLIYPLFLILLFVTACKGQDKTTPLSPASQSNTPAQTKNNAAYNGHAAIFRCSLQDKNGNLWFGTTGSGLFRYDGNSFTTYTTQDGLCDNHIYAILEDKSGNIWLGTEQGLCFYDGKKFTRIPMPSSKSGQPTAWNTLSGFRNEARPTNMVLSIFQDKTGSILFGTSNDGVYRYNGRSFTHFLDPAYPEESGSNAVKSILEDKNGNLWFGSWSNAGVYRFHADRINHPCTNNTCKHNLRVVHDLEAHQAERALSFTHITVKDGLSDDMISCILEDKTGNIWIGTRDQGACRYDGKSFTRFTERDGLARCVFCIAEDKNGNIWFGHDGQNGNDGRGISRYDGKTFTNFTGEDGLVNNNVLSILADKAGNLWLGTRLGGLCRYNGKTFTDFSNQTGQ